MTEKKQATSIKNVIENTNLILEAVKKGVYLFVIVLIVIWSIFNNELLVHWVSKITKAEFFGVKLEREIIESAKADLGKLIKNDDEKPRFLGNIINAPIARAEHSYAAIKGANLVWATDKPDDISNKLMIDILRKMSINVSVIQSTKAVMEYLSNNNTELVVSDVWFGKADLGTSPNVKCHVYYKSIPDTVDSTEKDLADFNKLQNKEAPGGYAIAEFIETKLKGEKPKLLFFSANNTEYSRSFCGDGSFNRYDLLLHAIISQLEEVRWEKLK